MMNSSKSNGLLNSLYLIQTPMGQKISEVSLFQGSNSKQELFLGVEKILLLEGCPHFRGVLREGFHCITISLLCPGIS